MKIRPLMLVWSLFVGLAVSARAETVTLGTFEEGKDAFAGITLDKSTGKDSASSARITKPAAKRWVTVSKKLNLEQELKSVSFWIKSDDVQSIAVKAIDSTGQTFQPRLSFKNDGNWQEIRVTATDFSTTRLIYGGARDKVLHHPIREIQFVLEHTGTVWIDDVKLELADEVLPEIAERRKALETAKPSVIATFEEGNDGFSKGFAIVPGEGRNGGACAKITKPADKRWTSATKPFTDLKNDFLQLSYWVKSNDVNNLAMRLTDSTGQEFQQRLPLKNDGEWHQIVVTRFNRGQSWGGAGDKNWHPPAKRITFVLEHNGTVFVDDIEAKLDPERIRADLDLSPTALGNIFLTTETPSIKIETKGDAVTWTVWDFEHNEVAQGSEMPEGGEVELLLPKRNGYFLARIEAQKDGKPLMEKWTSYCVLPPYQVKDPANAPWGAMTHFAQGMDTGILPLLKQAGIVSIRDEHYWSQVEKERGNYVFPEKSARYMEACQEVGIDPLIAMTFGNRLYDHPDGPSTPAGFEGYGNYGQAILKEYGEQIKWLEIWNEYNGTWAPPEAKQSFEARYTIYTEMLKVAYEKIKAVRPDVKVLGGAAVLIPLPYFEGIFKLGGLDYMDAVVIHPYRGKPEGVEKEVADLRELIKKYNGGQEKEIWVTETGKGGQSEFDWEKGQKMYEKGRQWSAMYLPRQYTLLLSQNVAKIYWYLAADHMNFVTMGLLRKPDDPLGRYAVSPAYVTYATLIRQLDGAHFVGREAFGQYSRAYVMKFRNEQDEDLRVCWATYPSKIEVETDKPMTLVDVVGLERTLAPEGGKAVVELDGKVLYLKGDIQSVKEIEPEEKVIASTLDDYGKTQGLNNWYYGYFEVKNGKPSGFKEMHVVETPWGERWAGGQNYMSLNANGAHPGATAWAVRRWKSNYAGKVQISGTVARGDKGDGTEIVILKDGQEIYRQTVGGGAPKELAVKVDTEIEEGSIIDICIDPIKGLDYDNTGYDLVMKTVK